MQESARERDSPADEECLRCKCGAAPNTASASHGGGGKTSSTTPSPTPAAPYSGPSPEVKETLNSLTLENKLLKDRLLQVGISLESSPLSDQEKELLLSKVCSVSQVSPAPCVLTSQVVAMPPLPCFTSMTLWESNLTSLNPVLVLWRV